MKKRRLIALLICLALCMGMLFSFAFVIVSAGHRCAGENCLVCLRTEACLKSMNAVAGLLGICAAAVIFVQLALSCGFFELSAAQCKTPVSLRVKISA